MDLQINRFLNRYSIPAMWAAGAACAGGIVFHHLIVIPMLAKPLFLLAAVLAGAPILWRAIQGLRFRTVGIEALVSIAVIGALCIGEFSEAGIVTFLFQFGSYLEQKTMKKTRSAIKELTRMAPSTAWRVEGETPERIDVDEVEEGDLLLVKTGGQIPVDGTVVRGEGYVNEASITGEAAPRHRRPGDSVYAGTLLDSGTIYMEATRVGEDTTFARIIALVEEAQDAKSPEERFIDKFARYYTPLVVVMAAAVFLLLRNPDTAITVLVLACPGALVIGAPIANVAGIGAGARQGILLKGGDSVHTFAKTDTVMLDKTGTLTMGQPEVVKACVYGAEEAQILRGAASAEQSSDHPLARAIVRYAGEQGISLTRAECAETRKGLGIQAEVDGKRILVGSLRLMEQEGIPVPEPVRQDVLREQKCGATTVLAVQDGRIRLLLAVSDRIKPDAEACIRQLRRMGVDSIVMLTGDNGSTAEAVASAVGIPQVHSELLPQDKLTMIRKMQQQGHIVTFVGDGVNDSPALAAADTGIAMGSGTDAAIESSDVVLLQSNLTGMTEALYLAKRTVAVLRQNIVIAVGTVLFLLAGLFAGYIHMAVGMLVHEASILAVILNAMRLLIIKRRK